MLKVCEPEVNSSGKRKDKYRCYNVKLNNRTFKDVPAKYKNKCSDCEEKNSCVYNTYDSYGFSISMYDCKNNRIFIHELISVIWYVLAALYALEVAISFAFDHTIHLKRILLFVAIETVLFFAGYFSEKLIIYMYYKNFCNVLSNSDEQYNYYKEVSSLIKSNSLKYESTSNNENLYSSYMNALDKIKKIEVLSENKAFSNASVIGNVNKVVEDLKHVFYMCVAIEKKQYDDKIFSEDLQNLYETIYYYKSAFDSGCNNSYYESKVHRALMCYDRKLEILEKSIMKDFEEIADKLEFDY